MPEQPSTQILQTTVRPADQGASRVELVLADAATVEDAETSIVISLTVPKGTRAAPFVVDLQNAALHRAVDLIREHTRPQDQFLESIRNR